MKFIYQNIKSDPYETYVNWLKQETVGQLKRSYGDSEGVKSTLFLYANRSYESQIPEEEIWKILALSIVEANYTEQEEELVLDMFEETSSLVRKVYGYA